MKGWKAVCEKKMVLRKIWCCYATLLPPYVPHCETQCLNVYNAENDVTFLARPVSADLLVHRKRTTESMNLQGNLQRGRFEPRNMLFGCRDFFSFFWGGGRVKKA